MSKPKINKSLFMMTLRNYLGRMTSRESINGV